MVVTEPATISARRAYEMLSEYGSPAKRGGPGPIFYDFRLNDGRPVSEMHRQASLAYLDGEVIPHAVAQHERLKEIATAQEASASQVRAAEERLKDLACLRRFLEQASVRQKP